MSVADSVKDRLPAAWQVVEDARPGFLDRAVSEELAGRLESDLTDDERRRVVARVARRVALAALDILREKATAEEAEGIRAQYEERIRTLKHLLAVLEAELAAPSARGGTIRKVP